MQSTKCDHKCICAACSRMWYTAWNTPVRWGSDCLRVPSAMERTMGIRFFFFSFWWWCLFSRASRTFTLTLSSSSWDASWWSSTMSTTHRHRKVHSRYSHQTIIKVFHISFYLYSIHVFVLLWPEFESIYKQQALCMRNLVNKEPKCCNYRAFSFNCCS